MQGAGGILPGQRCIFLAGWICFHLKPSYSKAIYYCLLVLSFVWSDRETQPKIQHQFPSGKMDAYFKDPVSQVLTDLCCSCLTPDLYNHEATGSPDHVLRSLEFCFTFAFIWEFSKLSFIVLIHSFNIYLFICFLCLSVDVHVWIVIVYIPQKAWRR